jgi:anti-sigma regulatory factor (Ser/Thr protein kinase)
VASVSTQREGSSAHAPSSIALTLAGDESSPRRARVALRQLGAGRGWRSADGELVLSELVTNAVRHGEGDIHVILTETGGRLSGEVVDHGPSFARPRVRLRPVSAGGWGLVIVAALTERWGLTVGASRAWFEMGAVIPA